MKFTLSIEHWPVVMTVLHGDMSDEDIQGMFDAWERVFSRREKFVSVCDARAVKTRASPKQRKTIGDWTERISPTVERYSLGSIIVVDNALVRGALTAIQWLFKPKVPQVYFSEMGEALEDARRRLAAEGLAFPASLKGAGRG